MGAHLLALIESLYFVHEQARLAPRYPKGVPGLLENAFNIADSRARCTQLLEYDVHSGCDESGQGRFTASESTIN